MRSASLVLILLLLAAQACLAQQTRFAVIGDFGCACQPEADVAALVKSWSPEFILTVGDNNDENGDGVLFVFSPSAHQTSPPR